MKFYIWDSRPRTNGSAAWWGPGGGGYTFDLNQAGEFEEADAKAIEACRVTDHAVPVELARQIATAQVDAGRLLEVMAAHSEATGKRKRR